MTHDSAIERAFLAEDFAVLVASLLVTAPAHTWLVNVVPVLRHPVQATSYAPMLVLFVPVWLWLAERTAIYRLRTIAGAGVARARALIAIQSGTALAIAALLVAGQVPLNRALIVLFLGLSAVLLATVMSLQRRWLQRHYHHVRNLVIGSGRPELTAEVERLRGRLVEALSDITPDQLRARLRTGPVDEVILLPGLPAERLRSVLDVCHEAGIPVLAATEAIDLALPAPRAEVIGERLYLLYHRRTHSRTSLLVKALLDRVLAAAGLVLCLPVFLVVAVAIYLRMGHPVLFIQQRAGLNGRPFPMLKFRTMRVGAEAEREGLLALNESDGPALKLRNDPRVSPLGRWLRKTSIDELPQLVNVLLGQMSLVGPRPLPLVETRELTGAERRRLSMRPGITCLWQVSGRSDLTFKDWMILDLQYIDQWSLLLDAAILARTIPAVLSRKGAH